MDVKKFQSLLGRLKTKNRRLVSSLGILRFQSLLGRLKT